MLGFGKKKAKKDAASEDEAGEEADEPKASAPEGEDADGEEGEDGAAPAKKKLPVKLIAIAAAAILVLGGGGGAAWFFLFKGDSEGGEHAEADGHGETASKGGGGHGAATDGEPIEIAGGGFIRPGPDGVVFYTLPDVLTNIQTTDGRPNALKLKITFEVHDQAQAELIGAQMPRLQDVLQNFLRELRPEDLNGSQGMYRLRQEIQRRVNLVISPSEVDAVLIEEMLQT